MTFNSVTTLRDYTNVPFEILICVLSIMPFFVLAYFYSDLPDQVPSFVKLNGEVFVWAEKSVLSVFRVPLMAVVTQLVCLLMKYGTLQSKAVAPAEIVAEQSEYFRLNAGLWDWFRWTAAFKMSAAALDTIFLSLASLNFLSRPAFIFTALAALCGVGGALVYGYRLLLAGRALKKLRNAAIDKQVDLQHVYGGVLYFNASDPAMFSNRYVFNFANKWSWVFIACLVAYPMLVFLPS